MNIADVKSRIAENGAVTEIETAIKKAEESSGYNVFLHISRDRAIERAKKVDSGEIKGSLAGVPFAVKDNFLHFDGATTAASRLLSNFTAPLQSEAIERLESEGAICVGSVNLDSFAHGGSTENSAFGVTKNAIDSTMVAGGSSGGSAVAVALDIVPFALGTDTGGSIRQPASFNGVVGFKPTYGTVSRYGVIAMASSTDTIGVLSSNIKDTESVMSIISGEDKKDMTTLPDFFTPKNIPNGKKKIAVIEEFITEGVDSGVRNFVDNAIRVYEKSGYVIEKISLPMIKYALAIYYVVIPAEISSNLSRYDGIRYGNRAEGLMGLEEVYAKTRSNGFMPENKRRIMIGNYVLSSGYFDAYYQKAQKARTLLIKEFTKALDNYDALIGPVAPTPAFKIGSKSSDPLTMYLEDIMTVPASLAGLPAISVPAGYSEGMPVGLQLIGKQKDDANILSLARILEETEK